MLRQTNKVIIDLHYLPSLEYFTCLLQFNQIIIEAKEHFQKQSYRNRCYIRGANNIQMLSIPVLQGSQNTQIKNVQINYRENWHLVHWRSICSAYGKAPFFEFFAEQFHVLYDKKTPSLFDFNQKLLTTCLDILQISVNITYSDKYLRSYSSDIYDARSLIHPKKNYNNRLFYQPQPYNQIFGKEFVANLSIIDLLFCEGINSRQILLDSIKAEQS